MTFTISPFVWGFIVAQIVDVLFIATLLIFAVRSVQNKRKG